MTNVKTGDWRHRGSRGMRQILLTLGFVLLWFVSSTSPIVAVAPVAPPKATSRHVSSNLVTAVTEAHAAPLPDEPAETQYAPVVAEVVRRISSERLHEYVGALSGEWPVDVNGASVTLSTRYSYADTILAQAEQYVLEYFAARGLDAACRPYQFKELKRCNIVAEQPGLLSPERVVLLTAHLDSTATDVDPMDLAPGADDNASGSAAVMAIADVLRHYDLPYTVRYLLFTGEEQGLYGSGAYAAELVAAKEDVVGIINLDMVGYNSEAAPAPVMQIHTRSSDESRQDLALAEVVTDAISIYELDLLPKIVPSGIGASDHASFWAEGYAAILAIEDFAGDRNPHYHTSHDRLASLDLPYLAEITRAMAAATMHLGGVVDFVHDPALISASKPVTFTAVSHLVTEPLIYSWDFGDGVSIEGTVVSHTFDSAVTSPGWTPPTVTLMVESAEGAMRVTRPLPVRMWDVVLPLVVRRNDGVGGLVEAETEKPLRTLKVGGYPAWLRSAEPSPICLVILSREVLRRFSTSIIDR